MVTIVVTGQLLEAFLKITNPALGPNFVTQPWGPIFGPTMGTQPWNPTMRSSNKTQPVDLLRDALVPKLGIPNLRPLSWDPTLAPYLH